MSSTSSPTRSSTDKLGPIGENRTSQIVTTILPPGTTFPLYQAGDNFYLVVATDVIKIKPNNGSENEYVQGTGLKVDDLNIFKNIQLRNDGSKAVVVKIFVGFGGYIDNRLIVYDPSVLQVVYPTAPINNTVNQIDIPDRSATAVTISNGLKYLLLNRQAIYVSNLDSGLVYSISAPAPSTDIFLSVQPQSNILFPVSGDYRIKIPSGNINAIVSEVYNAILPS